MMNRDNGEAHILPELLQAPEKLDPEASHAVTDGQGVLRFLMRKYERLQLAATQGHCVGILYLNEWCGK